MKERSQVASGLVGKECLVKAFEGKEWNELNCMNQNITASRGGTDGFLYIKSSI